MSNLKLSMPKAAELASRLAGINFMLPGIDWNPPINEKQRVSEFLEFLESRGALYRPFDNQMAHYVLQFVYETKNIIEDELGKINKPTIYRESLYGMKGACEKFIEKTQRLAGLEYRPELYLAGCLGEFKSIIGLHIARLACSYNIEVPGEIYSILPHSTNWQPAQCKMEAPPDNSVDLKKAKIKAVSKRIRSNKRGSAKIRS